MPRYRKKPLVVEACKYQAELGNNRIADWLVSHNVSIKGWWFPDGEIIISTPEGNMKVRDGDWIVIGVKGECYPCKDEIFTMTYDPMDY